MGRHLIPELSDALKAEGLLDKETDFSSVDQVLDGLEKTSTRLASTVNTPPPSRLNGGTTFSTDPGETEHRQGSALVS